MARHNLTLDVQNELRAILRRGGIGYGVKGGEVAAVLVRQGWTRPPEPPFEPWDGHTITICANIEQEKQNTHE